MKCQKVISLTRRPAEEAAESYCALWSFVINLERFSIECRLTKTKENEEEGKYL